MEPPRRTPFAVKVAIQTFAYAVGLVIFVVVDKLTGWVGLFH